jgi:nucleotide-binding universal stress UspA family protein
MRDALARSPARTARAVLTFAFKSTRPSNRRTPESAPMTATQEHSWLGFRNVLCAVDFSEHSRLALRHADLVARRTTSKMTVLYVNDPLLIAAAAAAMHDRHLAERSRRELQGFVHETLADRPGMRPAICLGEGQPSNEILRIGKRIGADLLVLGTQGLTGADRLLLGSTTLNLLRRTTIPVLAVPSTPELPVGMFAESWPTPRMLAAVELDTQARYDVDIASEIAHWFGTSLLIVHVVNTIPAPTWLKDDLTAHERIRIAQAEQRLGELVAAAHTSVNADTRVVCGQPADEIAVLAATEHCRLVMTTLRDRTGWFGAPRGSVSYHLLSHAVTPILALPPRWRPQ